MRKKILRITVILTICFCLTACKSSDYKEAVAYQEAGDFTSAAPIYESLGDYKDSATRLTECNNNISYDNAKSLIANKDYAGAKTVLEDLGDFSDSSDLVLFCDNMISAIDSFNKEVEVVKNKNSALETAISDAEGVVSSEEKALNEALRPELETTISEAKAAKVEIPVLAENPDEINAQSATMASVDYTAIIDSLSSKQSELETSIHQYALVNQPSEAYVIECLGKVPGVTGISAATEANDPNGHLGKAGGYTAAVYFSHENVDQSSVFGDTIIEKGTDCGGQIEVYTSEADANKRNEYLASFDSTPFAPGSHTVVGTCVVRTSDELTASQQKELEAAVIAALTGAY